MSFAYTYLQIKLFLEKRGCVLIATVIMITPLLNTL